MNQLLGKIGGRKFVVALFALAAVVLNSTLGINETAVITVGGIAAAYVMGQGVADGFSGGATSTVAQNNPPAPAQYDGPAANDHGGK